MPSVVPQLVGNTGLRALRAAIAEPEPFACEPKVDGARGLVVYRPGGEERSSIGFLGFSRPASGSLLQQIHIYGIADGRIIERWSSRDNLNQGIQVGLIPIGSRPERELITSRMRRCADARAIPGGPIR